MIACVAKPDFDRPQLRVRKQSQTSNEIDHAELYGLARADQATVNQLEVEGDVLVRKLQLHVQRLVKNVKIALHDLKGFPQFLAAECRVDEQTGISWVHFLGGQIKAEGIVL